MKRVVIFILLAALMVAAAPAVSAQDFTLFQPTGATLVRNRTVDLALFQWTPLAGATNYELTVFQVSNNPSGPGEREIGIAFSHTVAPGACSATMCSYFTTAPDRAAVTRGELAWTVVADTPGGDVEASNGAIFFSYDPNAIALMFNAGFDTGSTAPWKQTGAGGDKVKAGDGVGDSFAYVFKGSANENSVLSQSATIPYYNVKSGDSLSFSASYKTTGGGLNAKFQVKVKYAGSTGLPAEKFNIPTAPSAAYTSAALTIFPDGLVRKVTVYAKNNSTGGKWFVDNIQLVIHGQP